MHYYQTGSIVGEKNKLIMSNWGKGSWIRCEMSIGDEHSAGRIMITASQDIYFNIWISLSLKSMLGGSEN